MVSKNFLLLNLCLVLCACNKDVIYHRYRLETVDDVYLCIDNQTPGEYNSWTKELVETDSMSVKKVVMDSYDYCIAQLPYPLNLTEKEKDGEKICYDKNNKVELPVLYCQKDHNVMVNVDTNVNVSQTSIMKNSMYF